MPICGDPVLLMMPFSETRSVIVDRALARETVPPARLEANQILSKPMRELAPSSADRRLPRPESASVETIKSIFQK